MQWSKWRFRVVTQEEQSGVATCIVASPVELSVPMAFRRGGGASFGLVMPKDENQIKEHSWTVGGVPPVWGPVTLAGARWWSKDNEYDPIPLQLRMRRRKLKRKKMQMLMPVLRKAKEDLAALPLLRSESSLIR